MYLSVETVLIILHSAAFIAAWLYADSHGWN